METVGVFFFLVQILPSLVCLNFQIGKHGSRQAAFERFNNTCGYRNMIVIFTYDNMRTEHGKLIMNSTINVRKDITEELNYVINVDRCKNRENLDTCEHFYTQKVDDFCTMMEPGNMWYKLYENYVPEYRCPVKKGVYHAINSTVDASALLLFPQDNWYWKVRIEMHDQANGKMAMCLLADARIATV